MSINQQMLHERTIKSIDAKMADKYVYIITLLNKAADDGYFSLIFDKDEIKTECVFWLEDKGFEIYADIGENDEWTRITSTEHILRANRIKVVW